MLIHTAPPCQVQARRGWRFCVCAARSRAAGMKTAGAGDCRGGRDSSAAGRQCTPQAAGAASSPCRGAFPTAANRKASPVRGGGIALAMAEGCCTLPCQYPSGALHFPGCRTTCEFVPSKSLREDGRHRALRRGQGAAEGDGIVPPPGSNAPLRRLGAAITGLRYPHHAAHAEACLHSATAALPRSGKDRSGERLAPAGAVSEANRAAGPALRPEIGRSYAFYRRTGDNKRSDGRLPHEKQLSPPQAALGSVAPYRGGFQSSCPKAPLEGELSANADGRVPCRINFVHTLAYRHKHFDNVPQKFRSRGLRPYLNFSFFRSPFQSFPIRSKPEVLP